MDLPKSEQVGSLNPTKKSEILRYCREHETWEDGYPFYCDCFCGEGFGGNKKNIFKKIRYAEETERLKDTHKNVKQYELEKKPITYYEKNGYIIDEAFLEEYHDEIK